MATVYSKEGKKSSSVVRVSSRAPLSRKQSVVPKTNVFSDENLEATTPKCRAPLGLILLGQCLLVAGIFATLVAVVTVRVTSTTKSLVEERILSDLEYSKGSILSPIESAQQLVMAHRLRYLTSSQEAGRALCSEDTSEFLDSKDFIRDALSTVLTHAPAVEWIYTIHIGNKYIHQPDGAHQTFECAINKAYVYTRAQGVTRTSDGSITLEQTVNGFIGATSTVDNITDYRYADYVVNGMSYTDFGYHPYLWIEPTTLSAFLLIGGYVPILMNETFANGTVITFAPDLTVPQANKHDPAYTPVWAMATDISLAHVNNLIVSITPKTEGAHTSLYDLKQQVLLATSIDMAMMDASDMMWPAGGSTSEALNQAFSTVNPRANSNSTTRIIYHKDRILSAIYISTTSEIDFVIIQSTPIKFYLGTVYSLRTLMIVLGVCAAAFVVVVCVGLALLISRKIAEIEAGMLLAAVLKNDQVQPCRSFITEMDTLCVAFARMNAKLGAARAFMPQSMLVSDEGDPTENDDDEGANAESTITASKEGMSTSQSDRFSDSKRSAMVATTTNESSTPQHRHSKLPFQGTGLQSRRVTMLCINTLGFHRRVNDAMSIGTATTDFTSAIYEICVGHRGVIDSFHGDHFNLSFNAAKHNAQGPQTAARCGLDIIEALGPKVGFSMGVAAGRALVGHLGSTELKRFSIIGRVYSQAIALERVCKLVSAEGTKGGYSVPQILAERSLTPEIAHSFYLQALGRLEHDSTIVYGIVDGTSAPATNEEWLYEVMNSDGGNGAFDALLPAVNEAIENLLVGSSLLENFSLFGTAIGSAADLVANSPPLPGREHGQQALLRAMAVHQAAPEEALRMISYTI